MAEDNIAVALRVRPLIPAERKKQLKVQWDVRGNEIFLQDHQNLYREEAFTFDYILDTSASNADLYNVVQPLVHTTLNGFNATIFAYGQTSSGKTHSILGSNKDPGIIPRAAQDIFSVIGMNEQSKYMVRVCYVELYNEKINDLLDVQNKDLKISVGEDGKGAVLLGMHEQIVHNELEMMAVIQKGNKNRQISDTRMNEHSSRSHVICDILIESSSLDECENGEVEADTPVQAGHLYIVDLAGSERISQTGATGVRLNEGVHINKSLSVLISVITQLSSKANFVSYRDSKLTRLLSNALCGNSRTLIVAAITPVSIEDSLSTLKFARSAKTIITKPRLNEVMTTQSIIKRQKSREKELLQDLSEKGVLIEKLKEELIECRNSYVPPKVFRKPKPPSRRHTMCNPTDLMMEPIPECDEESKPINNDFISTRLSDQTEGACAEVKYEDLVVQLKQLDESHSSLKEFTKLEFDLMLQESINEEVAVYKRRLQQLQEENAQYRQECIDLKKSYEILDVSHIDLREFTKTEMEIAVNERTKQLQEECDKLKERLMIVEAEQELVQTSQSKQHQRRCDELLARIHELESKSVQTESEIASDYDECARAKAEIDFLQEKCDKFETSMKLTEKYSKILLAENNALKGFKLQLARSLSDSNLTAIANRDPDEEYTKEDFKEVFKSLRKLTSTIISGVKEADILDSTPFKMAQGRQRSKSEKPSSIDRISVGMQDEEYEDLKKENAMLKEHINELLTKLKTLNDKLNARVFAAEDVGHEARIQQLLEEDSKLGEDGIPRMDVQELENKVKQLESDMKECELLMAGQMEAQSKINQLTLELNEYKNQNAPKDSLPNQNSKFIEELQEKLKVGNEFIAEKDTCIKQLQEQLLEKDLSSKQLEVVQAERQQALDTVKHLEEEILQLNVHIEDYKTDMAAQGQHKQQVDDLQLKIVQIEGVVQEKEEVVKQKEEEVARLAGELKQRQHDHEMDKEALVYSSSELDEAMANITKQKAELKALKGECAARVAKLLEEVESYKSKWNAEESESRKEEALAAELATAKEIMQQKDAQIKEYQEQLQSSVELEVKLVHLQKEYVELKQAKDNYNDELLKMQLLLTQREDTLRQIQDTMATTEELWKKDKIAAESSQQDLQQQVESKQAHLEELMTSITALQEEVKSIQISKDLNRVELCKLEVLLEEKERKNVVLADECKDAKMSVEHLQKRIDAMKLTIEGLQTHQGENSEELMTLQTVLSEKECKLCDLLLELEAKNQEHHQHKMAAAVDRNTLQEEVQQLEMQIEDLTEKNAKLATLEDTLAQHVKTIADLDKNLKAIKQAWDNDKMAASAAIEEHQREIETKDLNLLELTAKITELQDRINIAKTQGDNKNEQVAEMQGLLTKKEESLNKLHAECQQLKEACNQHKMAASTMEKELLMLKQEQKQELETCVAKVSLLNQETEKVGILQGEINELNTKLANYKNMQASVQEQLDAALFDKENMIKSSESEVQTNAELEACLCKLKMLEETMQHTQNDYKTSLDKISKYEEEIASLKLDTDKKKAVDADYSVASELKDLHVKYEQAVVKINSLNAKLQALKKLESMQKQVDKAGENLNKTLSSLSDVEKVKILTDELHQKRVALHHLRDQYSYVKKDLEGSKKATNELHQQLETCRSQSKATLPKIPFFPISKKNAKEEQLVKDLEEKLSESELKKKEAEGLLREVCEEQQGAMSKIKHLEREIAQSQQNYEKLKSEYEQYLVNNQNSLKTERKDELLMVHWQKKYEGLKLEYEQCLMNNQNSYKSEKKYELENTRLQQQYERILSEFEAYKLNANNKNYLNVEHKETLEMKNELLVLQKTHQKEIKAMTEDFERKYRGYSDKYAVLKKLKETKEARIIELEAQLEQPNKENHQNQAQTVNSMFDTNKMEAFAKRKIHDLQQQLLVARQECQSKAVGYEKQISKIQEDYQKKLTAMQSKLDAAKSDPALPNAQDLDAAKEKERFARLIDAELFHIPPKLAMINKVTSSRLEANACALCSRVQLHIVELHSKCMEHSTWREFQLEVDSYSQSDRHDRQVDTNRFTLLTETRDVYMRLLQHCNSRDSRDLIMVKLARTTAEIEAHMNILKSQEAFLRFLHQELNTAGASISNEHKNITSACEQCPLFHVCFDAITALAERVKYSLVIIEGLGNKLNPLEFCVNSVKSLDQELEQLMNKLHHLQTQATNQKELDMFKEKYKRAKRLAEMRYKDVQLMADVLKEENYTIDFHANPTAIIKKTAEEIFALEDDNPRPCVGRSRDTGRKSFGATPKHFSPFFVTPDEHKEAKHEARRHK